jgi:hypothetical protein
MKVLVKTAVVPRKYYEYTIFQGNSNNLPEFFWNHFYFKIQVRKTNIKVIFKELADGVARCTVCASMRIVSPWRASTINTC